MDYPTQSLDIAYDLALTQAVEHSTLGGFWYLLDVVQTGHGLSRGRIGPQSMSTRWVHRHLNPSATLDHSYRISCQLSCRVC